LLKLKKAGRSGQTAGNGAVKLSEYYCVGKDSVCPKLRALIAKGFACIAKVVARKKVSKTWRFSVVS